jgi:hypothetical protein
MLFAAMAACSLATNLSLPKKFWLRRSPPDTGQTRRPAPGANYQMLQTRPAPAARRGASAPHSAEILRSRTIRPQVADSLAM